MPGKIILDTSIVIAHFRNDSEVSTQLAEAALLILPITALGELYTGAMHKKNNRDQAIEAVEDFTHFVQVLRPDKSTAQYYGKLRSQAMVKGKPIPDNDLWIAAMAVQYNLPLANRDTHFDVIEDLVQLKW